MMLEIGTLDRRRGPCDFLTAGRVIAGRDFSVAPDHQNRPFGSMAPPVDDFSAPIKKGLARVRMGVTLDKSFTENFGKACPRAHGRNLPFETAKPLHGVLMVVALEHGLLPEVSLQLQTLENSFNGSCAGTWVVTRTLLPNFGRG